MIGEAFGSHGRAQLGLDPGDYLSGFDFLECLVDDLLMALGDLSGQPQKQTNESPIGLLTLHRRELAGACFDHLTVHRRLLTPKQQTCPSNNAVLPSTTIAQQITPIQLTRLKLKLGNFHQPRLIPLDDLKCRASRG